MKKYDNKVEEGMSVWKIYGLLIFIFLCLLASVLLMRYGYYGDYYKSLKNTSLNSKVSDKFNKQLGNQQGEKSVVLTITEGDLEKTIVDEKDFPLKEAKVKIHPDKIVLTGKTSQGVLSLKCEVSIIPSVKDGKILYEFSEIKASGVKAPKIITESLNNKLSSYFNQKSVLAADIEVKEIKLFKGHLNILGERKK